MTGTTQNFCGPKCVRDSVDVPRATFQLLIEALTVQYVSNVAIGEASGETSMSLLTMLTVMTTMTTG